METQSNSNKTESRRKFLKTAGKFAIYTPPALMLMNKPSHATWKKTGGHTGHDYRNYYQKKREIISRLRDYFNNYRRRQYRRYHYRNHD